MSISDNDLPAVELIQAFTWTCHTCGRDNFERAITIDPERIDLTDVPDHIHEWLEEGGEGVGFLAVRAPTQVKCGHCGAEFRTEEA
jgi:hypothetical protein